MALALQPQLVQQLSTGDGVSALLMLTQVRGECLVVNNNIFDNLITICFLIKTLPHRHVS